MSLKLISVLIILSVLLAACGQEKKELTDKDLSQYTEPLIRVNKFLVKKDAELIENYIKRHKWKMEVSQTGLYYQVYQKGNGKSAATGLVATLNYKVSLMNGNLCYTSDSLGPKKFLIGKGGVESGLEEGILLLREGDKARFIMPPHLAWGIPGDGNKIPARETIIYDVELRSLTEK